MIFGIVRAWWEVDACRRRRHQIGVPFAKGGAFSPYYYDSIVYLMECQLENTLSRICWHCGSAVGKSASGIPAYFFRPGLTWPRRTTAASAFVSCLPVASLPTKARRHSSPMMIPRSCWPCSRLLNSSAFGLLVSLQLAARRLPPRILRGRRDPANADSDSVSRQRLQLSALGRSAWSLKRTLDTTTETSHAFLLPAALRAPDQPRRSKHQDDTSTTGQNKEFSVPSVPSVESLRL